MYFTYGMRNNLAQKCKSKCSSFFSQGSYCDYSPSPEIERKHCQAYETAANTAGSQEYGMITNIATYMPLNSMIR